MTITDLLILPEDERLHMYLDDRGIHTIGVGHNLDAKPISARASDTILEDDIADCEQAAIHTYPWFLPLDEVRRAVVVDMLFNVGPDGFAKFVKFIAAMERQDYIDASAEILNSHIAPKRAEDLAAMMQTGDWIPERG